jgi:hypothetical protein
MIKKNKASKTISQVLAEIETQDKKCKRIAKLLGYRSSEIPKTYRNFISLCNSISIVFMQFDLHHQAFYVLNKCVQCDVSMFFEGTVEDRTWYGRALLYCNLGYLMLIIDDIPSSLKFLYDAESLLLEIREMGKIDYNIEDLTLGHAALTFSILCKIGRISNAQKYLDIAITQFNSIAKKKRQTKINKNGVSNLYCLLIPAVSILKYSYEDTTIYMSEIYKETLKKVHDNSLAAVCLLEKYARSNEEGINMINSEEYRSILFITSFFPHIANTTPVIDFEELIEAQSISKDTPFNIDEIKNIPDHSESPDVYSVIMQEALSNIRSIF